MPAIKLNFVKSDKPTYLSNNIPDRDSDSPDAIKKTRLSILDHSNSKGSESDGFTMVEKIYENGNLIDFLNYTNISEPMLNKSKTINENIKLFPDNDSNTLTLNEMTQGFTRNCGIFSAVSSILSLDSGASFINNIMYDDGKYIYVKIHSKPNEQIVIKCERVYDYTEFKANFTDVRNELPHLFGELDYHPLWLHFIERALKTINEGRNLANGSESEKVLSHLIGFDLQIECFQMGDEIGENTTEIKPLSNQSFLEISDQDSINKLKQKYAEQKNKINLEKETMVDIFANVKTNTLKKINMEYERELSDLNRETGFDHFIIPKKAVLKDFVNHFNSTTGDPVIFAGISPSVKLSDNNTLIKGHFYSNVTGLIMQNKKWGFYFFNSLGISNEVSSILQKNLLMNPDNTPYSRLFFISLDELFDKFSTLIVCSARN
jgi:hypothetical protein